MAPYEIQPIEDPEYTKGMPTVPAMQYLEKFPLVFSLMEVIQGGKRWSKVVLRSFGNLYNLF